MVVPWWTSTTSILFLWWYWEKHWNTVDIKKVHTLLITCQVSKWDQDKSFQNVILVTTISCFPHTSGLRGGDTEAFPYQENHTRRAKFSKKYIKSPQNIWENVVWSDGTKIKLFGHISKRLSSAKTTPHIITSPRTVKWMMVAASCVVAVYLQLEVGF